jgi:hypothetical protein
MHCIDSQCANRESESDDAVATLTVAGSRFESWLNYLLFLIKRLFFQSFQINL